MRTLIAALVGLVCGTVHPAVAQQSESFGSAGQWVLEGSLGASYERPERVPGREHVRDSLTIWLAPGAMLFVATNFAIGAQVVLGVGRTSRVDGVDFHSMQLGANATLAYRIGLGEQVFLWPALQLGVTRIERSTTIAAREGYEAWRFRPLRDLFLPDSTVLSARVFVPLAFSPAGHFFCGLGPYVGVGYGSDRTVTSPSETWGLETGIATTLGTWF